MKLLVDVNILLDHALEREPWVAGATDLLAEIELGRASGFVAAHTVTTAFYLVTRAKGPLVAAAAISGFLRLLDVVPVDRSDLNQALALGYRDFEDAVQAVCALKLGADYIVTRDAKGFPSLPIPTRAPGDVVVILQRQASET